MHDPFQSYANLGQHYGQSPIGLQYSPFQTPGINPMAAAYNPYLGVSPWAQAGGVPQMGQQSPYGPGLGQNPILQQQLQLASALASQAGFQNPILAAILGNPLIAASLFSQGIGSPGGPQMGLQQHSLYPQIGQLGSPFGQSGYPLAPQSWIGQGGLLGAGQGFGQAHPFQSQLTQRPFQGQGFSPWGY